MTVISGIAGAVNGIGCVRNWSVDTDDSTSEVICSASDGAKQRLAGNTDWSGKFSQYAYEPTSSYMPGDSITFTGSIDGTNGATGTAIVDQIDITCDIEGGGAIELETTFSGNGALTLGSAAASDSTLAVPITGIGCSVEVSDAIASPSYSAIPDVRGWKLSLTAENTEYVSSSTAGGKKRLAGNVDATFSFDQYLDDWADLATQFTDVGDFCIVKLLFANTEFYLLKYGKVLNLSGLEVDRESAGLVGLTVNFGFSGVVDIAGTATKGQIDLPDATSWWS